MTYSETWVNAETYLASVSVVHSHWLRDKSCVLYSVPDDHDRAERRKDGWRYVGHGYRALKPIPYSDGRFAYGPMGDSENEALSLSLAEDLIWSLWSIDNESQVSAYQTPAGFIDDIRILHGAWVKDVDWKLQHIPLGLGSTCPPGHEPAGTGVRALYPIIGAHEGYRWGPLADTAERALHLLLAHHLCDALCVIEDRAKVYGPKRESV